MRQVVRTVYSAARTGANHSIVRWCLKIRRRRVFAPDVHLAKWHPLRQYLRPILRKSSQFSGESAFADPSQSSVVFLLHILTELPLAVQGMLWPSSIPFIQYVALNK